MAYPARYTSPINNKQASGKGRVFSLRIDEDYISIEIGKQNRYFLTLGGHGLARTGNAEYKAVSVGQNFPVDEYGVFGHDIAPCTHLRCD